MALTRVIQSGSLVRYMKQQKFIEFATKKEAEYHVTRMNEIARTRRKTYWMEMWKFSTGRNDYFHIHRLTKKKRWFSKVYRETQYKMNFNKQ